MTCAQVMSAVPWGGGCGCNPASGQKDCSATHGDNLLLQVGSIFELINQNAIFGVVPPGNPLYLPILGTFAVTGFPTTGVLTGYAFVGLLLACHR